MIYKHLFLIIHIKYILKFPYISGINDAKENNGPICIHFLCVAYIRIYIFIYIYIYVKETLKGIENCYPCITDSNYICK